MALRVKDEGITLHVGGVLALDVSLSTGWSYGQLYGAPVYGTWKIPKGSLGLRMACLARHVRQAIIDLKPALIVFESPLNLHVNRRVGTARLLMCLCGVVEMVAEDHGVPVLEESAAEVRKRVLGKVRFSRRGDDGEDVSDTKNQVMLWCRDQGWQPRNDNEGDSLVLLRYAHSMSRTRRTA